MRRIKYMWRYCIAVSLLLAFFLHAGAQNVVFTAAAGANKIGVKDRVEIQFTVRDAQNLQSITPSLKSPLFDVVGGPFQSQSSNTQIIGNKMITSESFTLTYVIQPKQEGTISIPPATAKDASGHTFQSNAVTIQVVAGSVMQQQRRRSADPFDDPNDPFAAMAQQMQAMQQMQMQRMQQMQQMRGNAQQQPQAQTPQQKAEEDEAAEKEVKKDLFIRVTVDKNKVHKGEQITTSYKLYTRLPMQVNISKLPSLDGFWTQDFEIPQPPKPTEEVLDGKKYQVFLLKKSALFPQQIGTLVLDATEAKGVARIVQQVKRRASDLFGGSLMMNDPFFNNAIFNTQAYKDIQVHLKSEPVKITVTDLPEKDKPAGYGGAVGNFKVSGKIDKTEITTDDIATLTLNITGSGNLKLIEAPKPELPNGLDTYDPQIKDTVTGRTTTISGTKTITYTITPHTPGDYDMPGVAFTYFNPQTGAYVTEHTEPIKLHVRPGKHYTPAQAPANNLAIKDIHDISTQPLKTVVLNSKPLLFSPGFLLLFALPLLAFLFFMLLKRRNEEESRNTVLTKRKRANKVALQRLTSARKFMQQGNRNAFYEEVSKAIWLYLSDKLNIPLSSLSKETAREALNSRSVPAALQKSMEDVVWECETALYATGGSKKMDGTYENAVKVISELEDVFKS